MNRINKVSRVLLGVSLLMITVMGIAHAAFFTINTNDGIDQTGLPTAFRVDPSGDPANYDILNFWAVSDANPPTEFYFRAELDGALPSGAYLEARLDCNNNGIFTESVDVLVDYQPFDTTTPDSIYYWNGDWSTYGDDYNTIYGEPTATTGAYEWRAPTSGIGNVVWTDCLSGQINVQLATVEPFGTDQDTTVSRGFDVPTAVTLQQITPSSHGTIFPLIMGLLALVGVTAYLMRRRRTLLK
jgi:hypothetical protein